MMLPRRVPFIGEVPLPMISSWPRSLTSPTSTHTFEVPMSSATMYFSSGLVIVRSPKSVRNGHRRHRPPLRHGHGDRMGRFEDDAIVATEVGGLDRARGESLGAHDGVAAP